MINLAWGGYTNGSVPDSVTAPVDSAGHRLEKTAAANWLAMAQECFNATGEWISIAPGAGSAGRTLSQQQNFWRIYMAGGNTAAPPGTSNHGWWRAADITGYETATSRWVGNTYVNDGPVWAWLMANMARFGFSWATGRASKESWHFESVAPPGSAATAGGNATPIDTEAANIQRIITNYDSEENMPHIYVQDQVADVEYPSGVIVAVGGGLQKPQVFKAAGRTDYTMFRDLYNAAAAKQNMPLINDSVWVSINADQMRRVVALYS